MFSIERNWILSFLVDRSKRCSMQDQRRPLRHRRACHHRRHHNVSWHRRAVHRHRNQLIHKSQHRRWTIVPRSNVISARWKIRWMKLTIWPQTRLRICKYRTLRIGKLDLWTKYLPLWRQIFFLSCLVRYLDYVDRSKILLTMTQRALDWSHFQMRAMIWSPYPMTNA